MPPVRLDGRVAIVTGAGNGLGRAHAMALAVRGASLVVNDRDPAAAAMVADEIVALGGTAIADSADVADADAVAGMVGRTMTDWGRVDILVNNAGNLRDRSFAKMAPADFRAVIDVHLIGSMVCSRAVWRAMCEQGYGRIVMTTSSSGLYGNFGQSNYGAAKMGVVGLMNTLSLEGQKYGIRINALAPMARTAMTEGIVQESAAFGMMTPESVAAGIVVLCCDDAPDRTILCAGGGTFAVARIIETQGIFLPPERVSPEAVLAGWSRLIDERNAARYDVARAQTVKFMDNARAWMARHEAGGG
ncbi:SDR family NAD(P)-dependent oxidoreductase [Sphingomonas colocasiae]|uniref:SDR family NAD(P)-dependent oxidoreductase n=2 Tax=Sphingomonas colocasiae TaxID=1848973 RepID=A0ABS7PQF5_9SPHN|nr:SDR family NAD(P)-dependent oxidoreductase [Sphingomonas colocasiae]